MEDAIPEWFYNKLAQYLQGPAKLDSRTLRHLNEDKIVLEDTVTLGKNNFRFILLAGNTRAHMGRRCGIPIPERDTYQPLDGFTPEAREQILYQILLCYVKFVNQMSDRVGKLDGVVKRLEQHVAPL
ncbi:MAG: hypothetical protein HYT16_02780 [DPANN group archaeon]|nr:hypothetical protein [DPANN group archaeon]